MDGNQRSISPSELYTRLGIASAPLVIDVRADADFERADRLIASAFHQSPETIQQWLGHLPNDRPIVVYCEHDHTISQTAATTLRAHGFDAAYIEGGFASWIERRLPTRRNIGAVPGKWVTRERPKIDRIACPWLIRRFINPNAEFIYVQTSRVLAVAKEVGGTPYDIEGVKFSHEGDRCSFDTFLRIYDIKVPALDHLATIVRGADTSRHDLAPQCAGLFSISLGLPANFPNDHEMLEHGMVIYDALYTWCRSLQAETHNWPAKSNV